MIQMISFAKERDTDVENKCIDTKGRRINWGIEIDVYSLFILCIK